MSWLQKIIYVYLNTLARLVFRVYFKRIVIHGKENIPKNTPTIVAPNHPNTMVDPVIMASIMPGWIHFLANYGLFKHPVSKFLMSNAFFSIPVKRPKDVQPGEVVNNLSTIKICSKVLANNGTIFMGPEATSYSYRRVRTLKDGISRIALTAAKSQKFKSGLVILPIGTNYSNPSQFRSEIIIHVGKPIQMDDYKDVYRKNKSATAQQVMSELRSRLESLSIHTQDEIEAQFLDWLETIGKTEGLYQNFKQRLDFDKKRIIQIQQLRNNKPEVFEETWELAYTYFTSLSANSTSDFYLKYNKKPSAIASFLKYLSYPIFIIANILNFQWHLPEIIFKKLKLYKSYTSMVKILGGIIFIPMIISLIFLLIYSLGNINYALLYLALSALLGLTILPLKNSYANYKKQSNVYHSSNKTTLVAHREILVRKLKELQLL